MKQAAICILDGMGPQAGGYLYNTLIQKAVRDYGAKNNDDFPEIILHSIPVPDFISADRYRSDALMMLKKRIKETEKLNISCLSIACNTAHVLFDELQRVSKIPLVSMIDAVAERVNEDSRKAVGLLATPSTIKYGLYQKALSKYGIKTILPLKKDLKILEKIIRNILSGKINIEDKNMLNKMVENLKRKGAEGIILGCTELPLLFPVKLDFPVYNSVEILANTLLQKYYKPHTMGEL